MLSYTQLHLFSRLSVVADNMNQHFHFHVQYTGHLNPTGYYRLFLRLLFGSQNKQLWLLCTEITLYLFIMTQT